MSCFLCLSGNHAQVGSFFLISVLVTSVSSYAKEVVIIESC